MFPNKYFHNHIKLLFRRTVISPLIFPAIVFKQASIPVSDGKRYENDPKVALVLRFPR